jgi:hypothetical protein
MTHMTPTTLTNVQAQQVAIARAALFIGAVTPAARALSAQIRACTDAGQRAELLAIARDLDIYSHRDFII